LRYRNLLVRQTVQGKNKIAQMLMEAGVSYSKEKLHQRGYFHQLLANNSEIDESLRRLLRLSRENIVRLRRTEAALVRSLKRDPLLTERVKRLMSIPAVGPITALTWVLELGDVKRFPCIKQVISYCGLCGGEVSSAGTAKRTPISKQRNRHLQTVLVEAAHLGPRLNPDLALLYQKEAQKGNRNRATLAVARKLVAYLFAVDRGERGFVTNQNHNGSAAA
jgi:transposase